MAKIEPGFGHRPDPMHPMQSPIGVGIQGSQMKETLGMPLYHPRAPGHPLDEDLVRVSYGA